MSRVVYLEKCKIMRLQPLRNHKIILKNFLFNIVIFGPKLEKFQMSKIFSVGGNVSKIASGLNIVLLRMQQKLMATMS